MTYGMYKPEFFSPGTGAGGFIGNPHIPDYNQINNSQMQMFNESMTNMTNNLVKSQQLELDRQKSEREFALQDQRLSMMKEEQDFDRVKFANMQKQQEIENQLNQKKAEREDLRMQIDMADFKNKEELSNIYREKMPLIMDTLDKAEYEDLFHNEDFKVVLAGMAAVDAKGAFGVMNDIYKKKAEKEDDRKAAATFKITEAIYTDELPNAIAALDSGKSMKDATQGLQKRLSELYKEGKIDHEAVTDQLKGYMQTLSTYSKNKSSKAERQLISYSKDGKTHDTVIRRQNGQEVPVTEKDIERGYVMSGGTKVTFDRSKLIKKQLSPDKIAYQIDPVTGKKTNVAGKKEDNFDDLF